MLNPFIIPEICNDHINAKYQQRFYSGFSPQHLVFTDIIQLLVLKRANWTSLVQIISRTISHLVSRQSGRVSTSCKVWKQVIVARSKPASCPHIVVTKSFNSHVTQAAITVCHRATKGPFHLDWTATSYLLQLGVQTAKHKALIMRQRKHARQVQRMWAVCIPVASDCNCPG